MQAREILRDWYGIVTTADLDRWIEGQRQAHGIGLSRYRALCQLVGERAATAMLNDLAIDQCCPAIVAAGL